MPDQNDANTDQAASSQKTDVPILVNTSEADAHAGRSNEPQGKRHSVFIKSIAFFKKKIIDDAWGKPIAELILGMVAVVAAWIYGNQLGVMKGQLREMQSSSAQTDLLIINAAHQVAELRESNGINKEALQSVQRAFVTFRDAPEMTLVNTPTRRFFTLEMPIENAGTTPAHGIKDRVSCSTPAGSLPVNYAFPDTRSGTCSTPWAATGAGVIAPKGTILSQEVFIDESVVREFIQQNSGPWPKRIGVPINPTRQIYFWGWVTYYDIFKDSEQHLSEFCRNLTFFDTTPQPRHGWGYCPTHNCTDDDCPDYKERIKASHAAPTYFSTKFPQGKK